MDHRTPSIGRLADERAIFYDYLPTVLHRGVGIFITGQSPLRTGLLKVGWPSAREEMSADDLTTGELFKPQDCATA